MSEYHKLRDAWHKAGDHAELQRLLNDPVLKRALEVVKAMSVPSPVALHELASKAPDAAMVSLNMTIATSLQAGVASALQLLQSLTRKPGKREDASQIEPFAHINEQYLHGRQPDTD